MADEFRHTNAGTEFPLADFSKTVYQMRLSDQADIPQEEFLAELQCMERYKMVVRRQAVDGARNAATRWYFRHDKIMEFFIIQTFLKHEERALDHLDDPRFRGIYFLLAMLLPLQAAENLKEELVQHTVKTNDTTVMAPFVDLLNSRKRMAASDISGMPK